MNAMKTLLAAAMMSGAAFASSAQAADLIYSGQDTQDGVNIAYSITTNGKTGTLLLSDIVASSITFTGTAGSRYGSFSPFTATNSLYFSNTNAGGVSPVSATVTDLLFNFAGDGGGLNFSTYNCVAIDTACTDSVTAPNDTVRGIVYALAAQGINDGDAVVYEHTGPARELDNPALFDSRLAAGTFTSVAPTNQSFAQVAAVSAVPEPAAWAMMILGMGAIGGVMRRRVRASEVRFDAKIKRIADGEALA